jgi:hypothetical protein
MPSELPVGLVSGRSSRCLIERANHALGLTIGPRLVEARQTVLDVASPAELVEGVGGPVTARLVGVRKLNIVVGQDGVVAVWNGSEERIEERDGGEGSGPAV